MRLHNSHQQDSFVSCDIVQYEDIDTETCDLKITVILEAKLICAVQFLTRAWHIRATDLLNR